MKLFLKMFTILFAINCYANASEKIVDAYIFYNCLQESICDYVQERAIQMSEEKAISRAENECKQETGRSSFSVIDTKISCGGRNWRKRYCHAVLNIKCL